MLSLARSLHCIFAGYSPLCQFIKHPEQKNTAALIVYAWGPLVHSEYFLLKQFFTSSFMLYIFIKLVLYLLSLPLPAFHLFFTFFFFSLCFLPFHHFFLHFSLSFKSSLLLVFLLILNEVQQRGRGHRSSSHWLWITRKLQVGFQMNFEHLWRGSQQSEPPSLS